ncbi:DUF7282 domain-containing protein [Halopiger goleimassiliensis]|uniref:DUF7282 domain-containing protein n=1 Tax=Halopiger goleimassiliensis TaxID=1293048 RepID=UPI000677EDC8|nr:hypothetical protein [Halopiger goleimassiliensis]
MSSGSILGTAKRIVAILLAIVIVLAAGVVIGQAPAIFGVEDDPEASITFPDQDGEGTNVTVEEVTLSDGGFVVLSDGDEVLTVSEYLEAGPHENVTIEKAENGPDLRGTITATVHQDTDDDETYAYEQTDGEEDRPYLEDGYPVSDTATVTIPGEDDPLTDSFAVEELDAPDFATTNGTVTVTAEISNPTDLELQQPVEIRIDGELLEQQTVDLGPGDAQEITSEIDTRTRAPGERTIGVYTNADGAHATIDLEFHTDPAVAVVNGTDDGLTIDAAIPTEGFVAVTDNETDERLGTSEQVAAGEHENVSVSFDENVTVADDDELRVALFEGDPDDPDAASPIEHDDEPVETVVTLEGARAAGERGDDADSEPDAGNETTDAGEGTDDGDE